MTRVGIIANPASGKDIRRLVAYGSTFDNEEKVRIVRRVLLGLAAVKVDRIFFMPDTYGIVERALEPLDLKIPISATSFRIRGNQEDSTRAPLEVGTAPTTYQCAARKARCTREAYEYRCLPTGRGESRQARSLRKW